MINSIKDFYQWEKISRDTIDVKRIYIDIAGDLVAGILLSQIIYWFIPGEKGSKIKINRDSRMWLAKKREDWWNECRISPKQFDRAIKILENKELVVVKNYKFNGSPVKHISLNEDKVIEIINSILTNEENGFLPLGNMEIDERVKSITKTTTKTTTKNNNINNQPSLEENQNNLFKNKENKPTPEEIAREFFNNQVFREKTIKQLVNSGQYSERQEIISEVSKFIDYWTERNKSGTKQRWELEKTFEIGRRLKTWFNNSRNWKKQNNKEIEFIT